MSEDKKDKVIGRGLSDLLSEHRLDEALEGEIIAEIPLTEISPNPFQPRKIFDDEKIEELGKSIKEHGVFQPIILKKRKNGYVIVTGERRYRAAKLVGLETIPAIVRQYEEAKVAEIALIENLQREDLTPIEEAEAYLNVMSFLHLNQQQLANRIGKSRSHVTNMLGLLTLPEDVQKLVLEQKITMGHARAISKIKNPKAIKKIAKEIVEKGLNVRETEELAKQETKTTPMIRQAKVNKYIELETEITAKYQIRTEITDKKIVIHVGENDDLKKIIKKIFDYEL